ncbi:hypothetical protein Psch_02425 [Pelotomaculum schinkii]|uniref:UPF0756 membrane protein Psch_02425 n=1 Tax=Pelotomaculum schinkii TaxID=78350 RepID=A0A4Y7R8W3_9FIRM|nr:MULTISPECIES: DUF441 domain-containing protein [Pelotomaculum]TEB05384.1 hypothetical protein Psch_02425 [Pelotomaculum schinkii]TEB17298.1 hypothetical protein Psfp_00522 [Pelotomaculum sp. FP]
MSEDIWGFSTPELILITLLFLGLFGRSNLVVTSACILLCIRYFNLDSVLLPVLEQRGLEIGLVLLMLHILSPVATDNLTKDDLYSLVSFKGFLALVAGALATKLNGDGLNLMNANPEIIFGMTVGTVLGILLLRGTPCGPVMAAAVTAVFLQITNLLR